MGPIALWERSAAIAKIIPDSSAICDADRLNPVASVSSGLHQFDAVAEGIVDEAPVIFFQRLVLGNRIACRFQCTDQGDKAVCQQGGVGLSRRGKILLDTKMDAHAAGFKPASAAPGKRCRLGDFGNAEKAVIKCP